ncbi:MAG: nitroreductase family deazaflavin-dependent oxidoreductase [Chloroflexi bacterium]|nr:MAG: nitroreductase family deazaflavin-dependent oxidoreductase [Chloroflexota bacterium]
MPETTLDALASARLCYLETVGRVSGRPHEIEIWFAVHAGALYFLAGGGERADWVRNIRANPAVRVRINGQWLHGSGRIITGEADDPLARRLLQEKYASSGEDLTEWARVSTPVRVDRLG